MKKAMLLASLATLCISGISGNALAVFADPNVDHPVLIATQPAGSIRILALGSTPTPPGAPFAATACSYLLRWSPLFMGAFPLGNAVPCLLNEQSNNTSFGCFFDAARNFTTLASAGPGSSICGPSYCAGYDQYGVTHLGDVNLVLTEIGMPSLGLPPSAPPGPVGAPPHPGTCAKIPVFVGSVCFGNFFPMPQSIQIDGCL